MNDPEAIAARLTVLLDYGLIGLAFAAVVLNAIFLARTMNPRLLALNAAGLALACVWLAFSIGLEVRGLS